MTKSNAESKTAQAADLSESERMAKIRELLVGPVIADESARVDQSVDRLHVLVNEQRETITTLEGRIRDLEESHRIGMERLRLRFQGMVEALMASEDDLRARVAESKTVLPGFESDEPHNSA